MLEVQDVEDSGCERADKDENPLDLLDTLHGMDHVKRTLDEMHKLWAVARQEGDVAPKVGHFVFKGASGTGKTTVARILGRILFGLGLLGSNRIVETSALELTGEYVGQTKNKVLNQLDEAKGGLLFIWVVVSLGRKPTILWWRP